MPFPYITNQDLLTRVPSGPINNTLDIGGKSSVPNLNPNGINFSGVYLGGPNVVGANSSPTSEQAQQPKPTPVVSSNLGQKKVDTINTTISNIDKQKSDAAARQAQMDALDAQAKPTDRVLPSGKLNPNYVAQQNTQNSNPKSDAEVIANLPPDGYSYFYNANGEKTALPDNGITPAGFSRENPATKPTSDTVTDMGGSGVSIVRYADGTYGRKTQQGDYAPSSEAEYNNLKDTNALYTARNNALKGIYTPEQQAQIDSIMNEYNTKIAQQQDLNNNIAGGIINKNTMSGTGYIQQSSALTTNLKQGFDNIATLTSYRDSDVAKMKQAILQQSETALKDAYDSFRENSNNIQKNIDKMQQTIQQAVQKNQTNLDSYGYAQSRKYPDALIYPGMSKQQIDDSVTSSKSYINEQNKKGNANLNGISGLSGDQIDKLQPLGLTPELAQNVSGIISGKLPPLVNYGANSKEGIAIRAGLNALGYDTTKAVLDYQATQKFIQSNNSPQQVKMKQAEDSVKQSLPNLQYLSDNYIRSGFKFLNKADLIAATNGVEGKEAAVKAQQILGQIALITDELGQTFMGGNSPTDAAFALAGKVLKGDFTKEQMDAQIKLLEDNLKYRENSWNSIEATGSNGKNIYSNKSTPTTQSTTPATSTKVEKNPDGTLKAVSF